jgi:hypothetical protein
MSTETHTTPTQAVSGVLWIWIESALAMTFGLVVVGGFFVLEGTTVQIVLGVLLVAETVRLYRMHRDRYELARDPRLRAHRERRGF